MRHSFFKINLVKAILLQVFTKLTYKHKSKHPPRKEWGSLTQWLPKQTNWHINIYIEWFLVELQLHGLDGRGDSLFKNSSTRSKIGTVWQYLSPSRAEDIYLPISPDSCNKPSSASIGGGGRPLSLYDFFMTDIWQHRHDSGTHQSICGNQ